MINSVPNNRDVQPIPYFAHPHVHTVINDNTFYEETVAEGRDPNQMPWSTVAVIGADKGVDNTFVRLTRRDVKNRIFGESNFTKYGQPSIQIDRLFNGNTAVHTMRVLPDNARYANHIAVAHYRRSPILDEFSQETGMYRMDIMFKIEHATTQNMTGGATDEVSIKEYAERHFNLVPDPITGYRTVPLYFTNSIGRGRYGDGYSLNIARNIEIEREDDLKVYSFTMIENYPRLQGVDRQFGSFYQTTRHGMSTLINDVIEYYPRGTVPMNITSFEDNFEILWDFYQATVESNRAWIEASGSEEDRADLAFASAMRPDQFDVVFGLRMNTRQDELIPFYRNYTADIGNPWIDPNHVVPNTDGATKPLNITQWNTVDVGMTVLVIADPLHGGRRMLYRVISIDEGTGNIVYDEGREVAIDADQYVGHNLNQNIGQRLTGGHDGDFQEITVNGETRPPTKAEMKILLSREYVKAFRGIKDRRILSPNRMRIDMIFDANYNMTADLDLEVDDGPRRIFGSYTALTDDDQNKLLATGIGGLPSLGIGRADVNVKRAIYDLNEFRTRNGMMIRRDEGAGSLAQLDCNLVGISNTNTLSRELIRFINAFEEFSGRNTSIDIGYYDIFDPSTSKRISVTSSYFLASELIPHLVRNGFNKPFAAQWAVLRSLTNDPRRMRISGEMIRGTFRPDIDEIDWEVKEEFFASRINYYETFNEGTEVRRSTQNTRQDGASALLEENNARTLSVIKRILEEKGRSILYEWNRPEQRQGYTDGAMEMFRPWIGMIVEDIQIRFTANEFEEKRMIIRCTAQVKFFNIIKRVIIAINLERAERSDS